MGFECFSVSWILCYCWHNINKCLVTFCRKFLSTLLHLSLNLDNLDQDYSEELGLPLTFLPSLKFLEIQCYEAQFSSYLVCPNLQFLSLTTSDEGGQVGELPVTLKELWLRSNRGLDGLKEVFQSCPSLKTLKLEQVEIYSEGFRSNL